MNNIINFPVPTHTYPGDEPYICFLSKIKNTLSDEDYVDFLEAFADPKFYETADQDIKDLVDSYYLEM